MGHVNPTVAHDASRHRLLRIGAPVTLDFLLTHLGYFGLLPLLPVILRDRLSAAGVAGVGAALFLLVISMRLSALLVSGWLEAQSPKRCMVAALALPAVAFAGLGLARELPAVLLLLVVAGLGISVNGLFARAIVANEVAERSQRLGVFSAINVAVNVAASAGPLLGALLYRADQPERLLTPVAACYLAAALAVAAVLPGTPRGEPTGFSLAARLRLLVALLLSATVWRLAAICGLGWFLYAQLFSALPLYLIDVVHQRELAATYFTANAVLMIALQAPMGRIAARLLGERRPPSALMAVGCGLIAAAFAVLGLFGWVVVLGYAAIALFSLGEVLFTPLVDAAFAEIEGLSTLERYNARQVVAAAGESLGSFAGASGYLVLRGLGGPSLYWLVLAAGAGMALALLTLLSPGAESRSL
jgi:DHA1 family multidrug resistance protein-like MFS transporter